MTEKGTVCELRFESTTDRANPVQDVRVEVAFTDAAGRTRTVPAFWDGGRRFAVRFAPDREGAWTWKTRASDAQDSGLHEVSGSLTVTPYTGPHAIIKHGPLRVDATRTHFEHADGTPFFWLGDTAWNGPLKASAADWDDFLADRARKGFTTMQVVLTQWLASAGDAEGRTAWLGRERIEIDPVFFQRLDQRMDAIARHGLVAVPILIWAAIWNQQTLHLNPGTFLPDDQIVLLARYLLARYGAQPAIWMLGGDSDYRGAEATRWHRIGRTVFEGHEGALVTMHPGGQIWVGPEFRREPWMSFLGYQGGHGDDEATLRWLVEGPPAADATTSPRMPVVNLEPNYEAHVAYHSKKPFDAHAVRRAAYWSLLVSPPAGVTYGVHGVWSWENRPAIPMAHLNAGVAPPWREAMVLPGSGHMKHLAAFFTSFAWWTLRPAPDALAVQPGARDATRWVAAARSEDGKLLVAYLPIGASIEWKADAVPAGAVARWFDPRAGTWKAETPASVQLRAPDDQDWVLLIQAR